ncbi:MAG TPA: NAD(P)/FAD-dependent oxidoreductase [Anaerolineae bacterium]|nr:NAD(P)/FAD-dependent oxidoreductase [Anaerolineae bacterium]
MKDKNQHIVIIGGGFGGLYAAKAMGSLPVKVTLIDKRNFHLFQPLLYQVATGGLSPADIASPLRSILSKQKNTRVLKAEVIDLDPVAKKVILRDGEVSYDALVVATGVSHHYFGNEQWAEQAPGLKTVEDALEMRRRLFLAFEAAEREDDPERRAAWMRFVIVGGGPTGVELAGALGELAHETLKNEFRQINPAEVEILLLEGADRLLPPYSPALSAQAQASLEKLGVTVRTGALVTDITAGSVTFRRGEQVAQLPTRTVLWAAGMKASLLGQVLAQRTGAELDRAGRVLVTPGLTVANHPDIFVIGDLAYSLDEAGRPLPGIAPVAMQQGRYVAEVIQRQLEGERVPDFSYFDKGTMAVIGRHAAVAQAGRLQVSGYLAWLMWVFIHIWYLVGFDNKLVVMFQWAWNYFTKNRGARLITGSDPFPLVGRVPVSPPSEGESEPQLVAVRSTAGIG